MKISEVLNRMIADAQKNGVSLKTLSERVLDYGKAKTSVRSYLLSQNILPEAKPQNYGFQAGQSIYQSLQNPKQDIADILNSNNKALPVRFAKKPWFELLKNSPSGFLASLIIYEEKSNYSFLLNSAYDASNWDASNLQGQGAGYVVTGAQQVLSGNVGAGVSSGISAAKVIANDLKNFFKGKKGTDLVDVYEFWKVGKGQVNEGKAVYSKFTKDYFEKNYRPDIEKGSLKYGLTYEDIAAVWPKYAPIWVGITERTGGGDAAWNELFAMIRDNEYSNKPQGAASGANLPEIGNIQTPWGNIKWGVTNNKAMIIYAAIGALVLVSIFYFAKKK